MCSQMENFGQWKAPCNQNGPWCVSIELIPSEETLFAYSGSDLDVRNKFNCSVNLRNIEIENQSPSEELFSMCISERTSLAYSDTKEFLSIKAIDTYSSMEANQPFQVNEASMPSAQDTMQAKQPLCQLQNNQAIKRYANAIGIHQNRFKKGQELNGKQNSAIFTNNIGSNHSDFIQNSAKRLNSSISNDLKIQYQTVSEKLCNLSIADPNSSNIDVEQLSSMYEQSNMSSVGKVIKRGTKSTVAQKGGLLLRWKKKENIVQGDGVQKLRAGSRKLRYRSENSAEKAIPTDSRDMSQQYYVRGRSLSPVEKPGFRTQFQAISGNSAFQKKKTQDVSEESTKSRNTQKTTRIRSLRQRNASKTQFSPCRTRLQTIHTKSSAQNNTPCLQIQKQNEQSLQIIAKKLHLTDRNDLIHCKSIRKAKKLHHEYTKKTNQLLTHAWQCRPKINNFSEYLPQQFLKS